MNKITKVAAAIESNIFSLFSLIARFVINSVVFTIIVILGLSFVT